MPSPETDDQPSSGQHVLVYAPLHGGPAMSVPCNEKGIVDLDSLCERSRTRYLLARALIGREYDLPVHVPPRG